MSSSTPDSLRIPAGPWSGVGDGAFAVPSRQAVSAGRAVLRVAIAATVTLTVIAAGMDRMGARAPVTLFVLLGAGAIAAEAFPARRRAVAVTVGLAALAILNPTFSVYFAALVFGLALARRRAALFAVILAVGAVLYPKFAFLRHYHQPGLWNWLNEPSLALALFVSALWWRALRNARDRDDHPVSTDLGSFLLLYFMPGHAANPMAFGPRMLAKHALATAADVPHLRRLAELLAWFVLKVAALAILRASAPHGFLRSTGLGDVQRWGRLDLWGVVAASYLEHYLALAASADVPVLIARLYGWSLPDPFRAALLAWNPVELWRRWGIYNRHLLLQIVYFPLGGGRRHRTRNVLLTFLASALGLHSGWFGSKYWTVGSGGWRDQTIYFLLQGLAVCACLTFRAPGADEAAPAGWFGRVSLRRLVGRVSATVATQAWSALVHVIVLAQGIDLATRVRLIARCLGD